MQKGRVSIDDFIHQIEATPSFFALWLYHLFYHNKFDSSVRILFLYQFFCLSRSFRLHNLTVNVTVQFNDNFIGFQTG